MARELWVAEIGAGWLAAASRGCVAGGLRESIFQPEWSPDGTLYFVSDRSRLVEPLSLARWRDRARSSQVAADRACRQWALGLATYAFTADGRIVCTYTEPGRPPTWPSIEPSVRGNRRTSRHRITTVGSLHLLESNAVYLGGSPTDAGRGGVARAGDRGARRFCGARPSSTVDAGLPLPHRKRSSFRPSTA